MKKLICAVALCLVSPITFADEAGVQKVLDSVHSKGFVGCDDRIRRMYEYRTVSHVETKMPFAREKIQDEVIVVIDDQGSAEYGRTGGISSVIFRKIGNRCVEAYNIDVDASIGSNCSQFAKQKLSKPKLVAETNNSFWMRRDGDIYQQGGTMRVYVPTGDGCIDITMPER